MLVSLHVMGTAPERLPLKRLHRYLSREFVGLAELTIGTPVMNVGEPDSCGTFYSDVAFTNRLPQWPDRMNMALIFTELPIEDNYFARNIKNVSIITTFQVLDALRGSEFEVWDYLVLKCIQEIFWISCKIYSGADRLPDLETAGGLFHSDRPGCLFNLSIHKLQQQVEKLRWATIESDCAERAQVTFMVPTHVVRRCQEALNRLTRPTFLRSFSRLLNVSYVNFIYGAVIGGLLTNLVITLVTANQTPSSVWYVFAALAGTAVAIPVAWHIRQLFRHHRRHTQI
jgi:hypothetical protein